jgi:hypothetical protein
MAERTITDSAGRTWKCASERSGGEAPEASQGRDVVLECTTPSVAEPVHVTVGWQWESMAEPGLARLIMLASPVPRG